MKILFLHGWHSVPGGVKPTYLASHGHEVINPQLDDDDFQAAIDTAQAAYDHHKPDVIVGSSRGGAVALNLTSEETPLVLLCPAWKKWGRTSELKRNSIILHSRSDDVVPFVNSQELIDINDLPSESLFEIGSDHRLADDHSLSVMLWACELLTTGEPLPWLDDFAEHQTDFHHVGNSDSQHEAAYVCDACGEEIVIPLDLSEGASQTYVEDCPVCCRANTIYVHLDEDGTFQIRAEPEQDYD